MSDTWLCTGFWATIWSSKHDIDNEKAGPFPDILSYFVHVLCDQIRSPHIGLSSDLGKFAKKLLQNVLYLSLFFFLFVVEPKSAGNMNSS